MLSRAGTRIPLTCRFAQPLKKSSVFRQTTNLRLLDSVLLNPLSRSLATVHTITARVDPAAPIVPPSASGVTEGGSSGSSGSSDSRSGGSGNYNSSSNDRKQSFFKSDTWTKTVGTIGALANWSIPLAAITAMLTKDGSSVDPRMTSALAVYSLLFMRWAIAISPANYPLLICHICNATAQIIQLGRYAMSDKTAPPEKKEKPVEAIID